VGYIFLS